MKRWKQQRKKKFDFEVLGVSWSAVSLCLMVQGRTHAVCECARGRQTSTHRADDCFVRWFCGKRMAIRYSKVEMKRFHS